MAAISPSTPPQTRSPHEYVSLWIAERISPRRRSYGNSNDVRPLSRRSHATAIQKVRLAEDAWNTRDPARVAPAYPIDSRWRNRSEFINKTTMEDIR
jgi:hypothetical protein